MLAVLILALDGAPEPPRIRQRSMFAKPNGCEIAKQLPHLRFLDSREARL